MDKKEILQNRYNEIKENIENIKNKHSIKKNIEIVAVTKYVAIDVVKYFFLLYPNSPLAESRAQSLRDRSLVIENANWHFIGQIQSNKIKYIVDSSSLIQSVDSVGIANEISKHALKKNKTIDILLEFNISGESQKGGERLESFKYFYENVIALSNIKVRGLMGMASYTDDTKKIENEFESLRNVFEKIKFEYRENLFDTLSMGMSSDYLIAVKHGSNMVRIGSYLFDGYMEK